MRSLTRFIPMGIATENKSVPNATLKTNNSNPPNSLTSAPNVYEQSERDIHRLKPLKYDNHWLCATGS
ncbi:hypothetical protein SDC9_182985 [bioreactor metagenome]|uniref:Uncharacterized protein n=1 Tax=bioreactor metagenome TaxID=1076179 RepID=A0A645H8Y2_9ZZZZ